MDPLPTPATRGPLFSRLALFVAAFLTCVLVLVTTCLLRGREWTPTLPLPVVLLTLMVFLPTGEFIRSRFKIGLRSLLVLLAAVAVVLGLFGKRANEARLQSQAVKSVLSLKQSSFEFPAPHSDVSYTENDFGGEFIRTRAGWIVPVWLVDVLGKDLFFDVYDISIQNQDLSAEDALDGVRLESFVSIHFSDCRLGPQAIRVIASLENLRELSLVNVGLTDDDLQEIGKLQKLESLHINCYENFGRPNKVTDSGLEEIAKLENLRALSAAGTPVTGIGLAHLKRLTKLEYLDMNRNEVTNEDVKLLAEFPALRGASFVDTGVNEDSMSFFESLARLDWVTLTPSSAEVEQRLTAEQELRPRAHRPAFFFH